MAPSVYFKDEIAQGIVGICAAMLSASAAHGGTNVEYCRGVLDMARAQALNYGLPWPEMTRQVIASEPDVLELIERALPSGGQ